MFSVIYLELNYTHPCLPIEKIKERKGNEKGLNGLTNKMESLIFFFIICKEDEIH